MKKYLVRVYQSVKSFREQSLPRFFVVSPFMSGLYYLLFSNKFKREQFAVLTGKLKHLKEKKGDKSNIYTLIRNIHRLEKGLLMKPRREVFALDFIVETVDVFQSVYENTLLTPDTQTKWFCDVLEEYFNTSGPHSVVSKQSNRFNSIINNTNSACESKSIPYKRLESNKPSISFEDFYALTKYRRSVRWFKDMPVPRELIDKAILAANQSPSACNRQPFEYRIIDEVELLRTVSSLPMGVRGYESGIRMMIVVVGNLDAYFDERDRHIIYIDASLANMSLMLALETLGLGSCAINWPDIESLELKMENALELGKHQRPIMCMAVGYPDPDGLVAFSEKRSLDYIRKYNN